MSDVTTPAAIPTPEPVGNDNAFSRILGVIISPKPTFASIAARPTWIVPLTIMVVMSLTTIFIFSKKVGWRVFMIHQDEQSERFQKQTADMSQEKKDEIVETQIAVASKFAYVSGFLIPIIATLIAAGVLMLGFMVIAGARPTFGQSVGIVTHAWVGPGIITGLLGILIIFLKDPSTVDLNALVASNVGAFLPDESAKWLKALLGGIDIFSLWSVLLMAFGFSAVDPKRVSVGKAFGIVVALFVVWTVVKAGLATLS
jgi:Yip1 domain